MVSREGQDATGRVPVDEELFDEEFQRRLATLALVSRTAVAGRFRAERRSRRIGSGVEFADHREYMPGDDIRYLDWNVYQRFGKLLVRLYEEQEDLGIHFIVDNSTSMGVDGGAKLRHAKRVVAALAYVGLANLDRISVTAVGSSIDGRMPETRGRGRIFKVFRFLQSLRPHGVTNLGDAIKTFVAEHKRRGMAVLVSDMFDPAGFTRGINTLRHNRFDPFVIHVTDRADARPNLHGDVVVYDCETGDEREVTVTSKLLDRYEAAYASYLSDVATFCTAEQVPYVQADVTLPFDELVLRIFRRGGFLR